MSLLRLFVHIENGSLISKCHEEFGNQRDANSQVLRVTGVKCEGLANGMSI